MTSNQQLAAFVSELCSTVASFDRPYLDLQTLADGSVVLIATSASHHKIRTLERCAFQAGLDVSNPLLLVLPHAVVRVPATAVIQ